MHKAASSTQTCVCVLPEALHHHPPSRPDEGPRRWSTRAVLTTAQKRTEEHQSRWEPCKVSIQSSGEPGYQVLAQVSPPALLKALLQTVPPTEARAGAAHIACARCPLPSSLRSDIWICSALPCSRPAQEGSCNTHPTRLFPLCMERVARRPLPFLFKGLQSNQQRFRGLTGEAKHHPHPLFPGFSFAPYLQAGRSRWRKLS